MKKEEKEAKALEEENNKLVKNVVSKKKMKTKSLAMKMLKNWKVALGVIKWKMHVRLVIS